MVAPMQVTTVRAAYVVGCLLLAASHSPIITPFKSNDDEENSIYHIGLCGADDDLL